MKSVASCCGSSPAAASVKSSGSSRERMSPAGMPAFRRGRSGRIETGAARQLLLPVGFGLGPFAGIAILLLPDCEVGVLNRQLGQGSWPALGEGFVDWAEFVGDDADRPSIAKRCDACVISSTCSCSSIRSSRGRSKGPADRWKRLPRLLFREAVRLLPPLRLGQMPQVPQRHRDRQRGCHQLHYMAVGHFKTSTRRISCRRITSLIARSSAAVCR